MLSWPVWSHDNVGKEGANNAAKPRISRFRIRLWPDGDEKVLEQRGPLSAVGLGTRVPPLSNSGIDS